MENINNGTAVGSIGFSKRSTRTLTVNSGNIGEATDFKFVGCNVVQLSGEY